MANRGIREGLDVYAQEVIKEGFFSQIYDIPVLAAAFGLANKASPMFGGDVNVALGRKLSGPQMETIDGGTLLHSKFHLQQGSTDAKVAYNGAGVDVSGGNGWIVDGGSKTFSTAWVEYESGVKIGNDDLDANRGKYALGSLVQDALQDTIGGQLSDIGTDLYTGLPSDFTLEKYDDIIGLQAWIHDGNNICGVDRSVGANAGFRGVRSTATLTLSLDLIDAFMMKGVEDGAAGTTTPLYDKNAKLDLIVTSGANYYTLKQEALNRGGILMHNKMPDASQVGQLKEWIEYNGIIIVADPKCPADHLFGLDMSTWTLQFLRDKNFKMGQFVNPKEVLPASGQDNFSYAALQTQTRLHCYAPWKNIQLTDVS